MADAQSTLRLALVHENALPNPMAQRKPHTATRFNRAELSAILNIYGRKVAAGEWRDYAVDFLKDRALFSVYRHYSERALYVIEKNPRLRHGAYLVTGQDGRVLKRGHELENVLKALEPKLALVK